MQITSTIYRFAIGAAMLLAGSPQLSGQAAFAQAIERYSLESLWLSQVGQSMQDFVGMLEPVFDVTFAMTDEYPDIETYQSQASAAIEAARTRLGMIHENTVWMIDALPERPETTNRTAADLFGKVGDPKKRANDLRTMTDAIISNFEASMSGDIAAQDRGILTVIALLDELALINDFIVEIEAAHVGGDHPVVVHALRADKETLRAIVRMRQLEFVIGLSDPGDAEAKIRAELVDSVKSVRIESEKVVREMAIYRKQVSGDPFFGERDKQILKEYQDTEEVRARFISAMGAVIYQFTRPDMDVDALANSMEKAVELVAYMDPKHRQFEKIRGRPAMPPPDAGVSEANANL